MLTRRQFLVGSAVVAASGLATGLYTWQVEPHWVEFVERPLPIEFLPDALVGRRLVQLSDLHVGPRVADDYVLDAFARVSALQPDIVAYTGDFTSYHPGVFAHAERIYARLPKAAWRRSAFSATTITDLAGRAAKRPSAWRPSFVPPESSSCAIS
jgi:hypothetical protein